MNRLQSWWREFRRVWFEPIWIEGTGIKWVLEDGRVLTQDEFLLICAERGGDRWFFDERTHWDTRWNDGHRVSTIWLGLDHSFTMTGHARPARCWETCVFGPYGSGSGVTERYATKWLALKGHLKMVAIVQFYRLKAALRREPRLKLQTENLDDGREQGGGASGDQPGTAAEHRDRPAEG